MFEASQHILHLAVQWLRLLLETVGALVIAAGAVHGLLALLAARSAPADGRFVPIRLTLARYLSLALEFQLAADVLSTAISPSWDEIGKLAAIAVIRTGLNYFLGLEIKAESPAAAAPEDPGPTRDRANPVAGP
ncbi:MAG: DUF1622 domain-containing protein [Deltaproteobacteria bacterium]